MKIFSLLYFGDYDQFLFWQPFLKSLYTSVSDTQNDNDRQSLLEGLATYILTCVKIYQLDHGNNCAKYL